MIKIAYYAHSLIQILELDCRPGFCTGMEVEGNSADTDMIIISLEVAWFFSISCRTWLGFTEQTW